MSADERSLIPVLGRSLASPTAGAERILSAMVGEALALMMDTTVERFDLDEMVREAKRIQRREGMTPEDIQAFNLFHQAATAGHPEGQYRVFECYHFGYGIAKDAKAELEWVRKSAESGFSGAQYHLGWCYGAGEGVPRDDVEKVKWYRKAAEQGHASAQNNLGVHYQFSDHDWVEASIWYRKAAEQGLPGSQFNLGFSFYNRCDAPLRERKFSFDVLDEKTGEVVIPANKRITTARLAELARTYNQIDVTGSPLNGLIREVIRNFEEAASWFLKAAEQGHTAAQYAIAICYQNGDGVSQNYGEALRWFQKATEQGHICAQYSLGCCYSNGTGVLQDHSEAAKWFQKASKSGNAMATRALAKCFQYGMGVEVDLQAAYILFQLEETRWFQNFLDDSMSHILVGIRNRKEVERDVAALTAMMSQSELEAAERSWLEIMSKNEAKE